jgi:putative PIN family toxin of toxin-antitoxin system
VRVVLDTNVIVSGLLSSKGAPARILEASLTGELTPVVDHRILAEYHEVLARPRFDFDAKAVAAVLRAFMSAAELVSAAPLAATLLPDPDDLPFLEVAVGAAADALVTGNLRHFPPAARRGVLVVSPRELLERMTRRQSPP